MPIYYPQRVPEGALRAPKTNYILNFNSFSTTRPILDLKVSLDKAS